MSLLNQERVLDVHHWNESLFSFTTTRDPSLRFRNGHFVMIGLEVEGRPLLRAFSFASANYDDHLEFYSIKVPDGPLTSRLRNIKPGDPILVGRKPTGTLLLDHLLPGKRLYLLGSGTGLAPFMSLVRDPDAYERFEHIVLAHSVRRVSDLGYRRTIEEELPQHELVGEQVRRQLLYYPTVTREPFRNQGRLTTLVHTGKLAADLGLPDLDPEHDRVMICGSPGLLADFIAILRARGFEEGSSDASGHYVIERAFVEK
jgi:ferredoxin--NADP+ reductase